MSWINEFLEIASEKPEGIYIAIPNAASLLNDYYWRLIIDFLRPLLVYSEGEKEHNLHYYKIISASELTVMAVMPLKFKENNSREARKKLNAEFAFFVATSIILNWKINNKTTVTYSSFQKVINNKELIDYEDDGKPRFFAVDFEDEHIDWLKDLNTAAPLPILSNSQTWRLCFLATRALMNHGKL